MKVIFWIFLILALLAPIATSSSHHHKHRTCYKKLKIHIGDVCGSECLGDLKLVQNVVCLGGTVTNEQLKDVCCPDQE
ncbi:Protein CBG26611 [Caenorhabditis briggsae]|uniref:Protein CBG26611 n=1 Tax=Caenorhabditis briggsae TaxID=6238 RepID=B6IL11_CAEBR|nr:Protein CBG26611 [Caenorhabditis briggsae]CAS00591.1 Protein CBG26611 [Caenorhabditis briggsae]